MSFVVFLLLLEFFLHVVYNDSTKVVSVDLSDELCCNLVANKCEVGFLWEKK